MGILLCGCSVLKSLSTGYPIWYYNPSIPKNQVSFLGQGTAESRRQAELLAYADMSENLASYLGFELDRTLYRELLTSGTIESYGIRIQNSNSTQLDDGNYRVIVLAVTEKEMLDSLRSREAVDLGDRVELIGSLIAQGDEAIRQNRDIEGLKYYLRSMALSYGIESRSLNRDYRFDAILDEVLYVLESLNLTVTSEDSGGVSCVVGARRRVGFASSAVVGCPVKASYTAVDGRNSRYADSYIFLTGNEGTFEFYPVNPSILISGTVVFSFDLETEVAAVGRASPQAEARINEVLAGKTARFEYHRQYAMGTIAVTVLDYGNLGIFEDSRSSSEYLTARFVDDGAPAYSMSCDDPGDEAILDLTGSAHPDVGVVFVARTGVIETIASSTGVCAASMEGRGVLYRILDGEMLFDSGIIYATGFGADEAEAVKEGRMRIADLFYSLLKAVYV